MLTMFGWEILSNINVRNNIQILVKKLHRTYINSRMPKSWLVKFILLNNFEKPCSAEICLKILDAEKSSDQVSAPF